MLHFSADIIVSQSHQQVVALFDDPYFLPKWDRSVEQIIPTSPSQDAVVGFTFDTIAPKKRWQKQGLRMSYRIIEHTQGYQTKIRLEHSNMFKDAIWTMRFEAVDGGTLVTCLVDLKLKNRYIWLAPMLRWNKKALLTDMLFLKEAIAQNAPSLNL